MNKWIIISVLKKKLRELIQMLYNLFAIREELERERIRLRFECEMKSLLERLEKEELDGEKTD